MTVYLHLIIATKLQCVQWSTMIVRCLCTTNSTQRRVSDLYQPLSFDPIGTKSQPDALSKSQKISHPELTRFVELSIVKELPVNKQPASKTNSMKLTRSLISSDFRGSWAIEGWQLMIDHGIIRSASSGMFHYLPLATKSLHKLIKLVDHEMMQHLTCQKMEMSLLIAKNLLTTTGRWSELESELFRVEDRQNRILCLGPTYEESITDLLKSGGKVSHKQLPLRLYQITKKYRDEPRAKFGLMRAKEFLMKDLYSFDKDEETAKATYEQVCKSYENIFTKLGLNAVKVRASTGSIGGELSHEYHLQSEIGEDQFLYCQSCKEGFNAELGGNETVCQTCKSPLQRRKGIEVGHTFLLGTRYSKPMNATFVTSQGTESYLYMGCYGIGISRLLAAGIEVLSTQDEIRWPKSIAPYQICIIPPKRGSKEEAVTSMATHLYERLTSDLFPDDVLYDDRLRMSIGERLTVDRKAGHPYIVIVAKMALESKPLIEVHNIYSGNSQFLTHAELFQYFKKMLQSQ